MPQVCSSCDSSKPDGPAPMMATWVLDMVGQQIKDCCGPNHGRSTPEFVLLFKGAALRAAGYTLAPLVHPARGCMARVTYIQPDGRAQTLAVDSGSSVMRAAMDAGIDGIEAQCGGLCACATCHCYVRE